MKFFVIGGLLLSSSCFAQKLPPACEQYFAAVEACTENAVSVYSRTDTKTAKSLQESLADFKKTRSSIHEEALKVGADTVNERCTQPQFTNGMVQHLQNTVSVLTLTQTIDASCMTKFRAIILPQG